MGRSKSHQFIDIVCVRVVIDASRRKSGLGWKQPMVGHPSLDLVSLPLIGKREVRGKVTVKMTALPTMRPEAEFASGAEAHLARCSVKNCLSARLRICAGRTPIFTIGECHLMTEILNSDVDQMWVLHDFWWMSATPAAMTKRQQDLLTIALGVSEPI
jgi:hypothetical protein